MNIIALGLPITFCVFEVGGPVSLSLSKTRAQRPLPACFDRLPMTYSVLLKHSHERWIGLTRSTLRWTTLSPAAPQRGLKKRFFSPLCNEVGERADGRSRVGVSLLRPVYVMLPSEVTDFTTQHDALFTGIISTFTARGF
jgi:hypothetical protein